MSSLRKAAVLIPLVIENGSLYLWLTVRSDKVGRDKGHVSFPGGNRDDTDSDAVHTAVREAEEEIGLRPDLDLIEILGQLPPRISRHRVLVTPILAVVRPEFRPIPNEEVEFAFRPPLERFLSHEGHWMNGFGNRSIPSTMAYLHFFRDYDETGRMAVTFGLTASFCLTVACAILQRAPEFEYSPGVRITADDPFGQLNKFIEEVFPDSVPPDMNSKL